MLKVIGYDEAGHPQNLPRTVDEYYAGVPKRFAGIRKMIMIYDSSISVEGGSLTGDFALLKAFLADHDREISVEIRAEETDVRLFFPAYLYGFVEDTFARAIHHKIEGVGYTLRECVGKYEIRIREYDSLFFRVTNSDAAVAWEAGRIALSRLICPVNLSNEHSRAYTSYLKERDEEVLLVVTEDKMDAEEAAAFMTANELVSEQAVRNVLPGLQDASDAPVVAMLLRYLNKEKGSGHESSGRMTLF